MRQPRRGPGRPPIDPRTVAPEFRELIGGQEAARILGVTRQHVVKLRVGGKLPSIQTPIGRVYRRRDVVELAYRRNQAKAET
jgi:hypothetical protein